MGLLLILGPALVGLLLVLLGLRKSPLATSLIVCALLLAMVGMYYVPSEIWSASSVLTTMMFIVLLWTGPLFALVAAGAAVVFMVRTFSSYAKGAPSTRTSNIMLVVNLLIVILAVLIINIRVQIPF